MRIPATRSYTTKLLTGGVQNIGEKITEEAAEVVEAAARSRLARGASTPGSRGGGPDLPPVRHARLHGDFAVRSRGRVGPAFRHFGTRGKGDRDRPKEKSG